MLIYSSSRNAEYSTVYMFVRNIHTHVNVMKLYKLKSSRRAVHQMTIVPECKSAACSRAPCPSSSARSAASSPTRSSSAPPGSPGPTPRRSTCSTEPGMPPSGNAWPTVKSCLIFGESPSSRWSPSFSECSAELQGTKLHSFRESGEHFRLGSLLPSST